MAAGAGKSGSRGPLIGLWIFVGLWSLGFSLYHLAAYRSFDMYFDIALSTNELWNLAHGNPLTSLYGSHFLGDHQQFIAYLFLPLFKLLPHPALLTTVQSVAMGLGAVSVYALARALLGSRAWAGIFAGLYLLYPPLWNVAGYEFHFEALATPILLTAMWAYVAGRFGLFLLCLALALACKENLSLVVAAFGCVALFQPGRRRWGVISLLVGLSWFALLVSVIQPAVWVDRARNFWSLYHEWGEGRNGVLFGILAHPHRVLMRVAGDGSFWSCQLHLLLPLGFLPLLSPAWLLAAVPIWVQHFLSSNRVEHTVWYHYTAPVTPFVFMAAMAGLRTTLKRLPRLQSVKAQWYLAGLLGALTCFAGLQFPSSLDRGYQTGAYPAFLGRLVENWRPSPLDRVRRRLIDALPAQASVVSSDDMLVHVVRRPTVYAWHALLWPYEPLKSVLAVTPAHQAEYLLIDFADASIRSSALDRGTAQRWKVLLERGGWRPDLMIDGLSRWSRAPAAPVILADFVPSSPAPQQPVGQQVTPDLRLLGADLSSAPFDGQRLLTLHLYWEAVRDVHALYFVGCEVKEQGRLLNEFRPRAMGYGIMPTIHWKKGMRVKELQTVLLQPSDGREVAVSLYLYTERMRLYDPASKRFALQFPYDPVMRRVGVGSFRVEGDAWRPAAGSPLPGLIENLYEGGAP